uniref:RING-type E3 ubiquitin transferase n=1 Tax=Arcella intermedia TaxID=1963864 RepID=A0A6B2LJN9_9EUKA
MVEYTNDANPVQLPCKHNFCLNCVVQCYTKGFLLCAICKTCYGTMIGSMPPGKLSISHHPPGTIPLEGHENEGTIVLNMHIKSGIQGPDHPNPGEPYDGTSRTAYLPDNSEGRELLELFKVAWERKLMFRVGTSVTTGAENQVVWNGIHMKTNTHGGATSFGYPDPTYGQRVKEELAAKNIK